MVCSSQGQSHLDMSSFSILVTFYLYCIIQEGATLLSKQKSTLRVPYHRKLTMHFLTRTYFLNLRLYRTKFTSFGLASMGISSLPCRYPMYQRGWLFFMSVTSATTLVSYKLTKPSTHFIFNKAHVTHLCEAICVTLIPRVLF